MATPERFRALSDGLVSGVRGADELAGLVLLGSASDDAAARRDEWSDHDFFALAPAGRGEAARRDLSWLPDHDRIVLTAREGGIGFVALYDDGHVFEFAVADAEELAGAVAGDATIAVDDAAGTAAELIATARARASAGDVFDPGADVRLALVKLLIGAGRARRGEVIVGGALVRQWAVQHLVRAVRGRAGEASGAHRDPIDPTRRFERDFPVAAEGIAAAVAQPVEDAARDLFRLTRALLEPGWAEFPSRAADAVAARLGWDA